MKKKFIDFNTFKALESNSLTAIEKELNEASEILAKVLNEKVLSVHCLNENDVTFINADGNLIHADISMDKNNLILENIEELVIDESSFNNGRKEIVNKMVESILEDNLAEASIRFSDYFNNATLKANLREGIISEAEEKEEKKSKKKGKMPEGLLKYFQAKAKKKGMSSDKMMKRKAKKGKFHGKRLSKLGKMAGDKKMHEWNVISTNILEFVDFKNSGNVFQNVRSNRDGNGNVTSLSLPRTHVRNEGKILSFTWNVCNAAAENGRKDAKKMGMHESNWVRAVNDIKRLNALNETESLETAFENIAAAWPNVIYLTASELSSKINETLDASGAGNYDDSTCDFLADGILRTAHKAYGDKVNKVYSIAGKQFNSDDFDGFSAIAESVYRNLDENIKTQYQVFADLYRGLSEAYRTAERMGDEATKAETASFIHECELVLNKRAEPSLDLAEDAALYLQTISEGSDFDSKDWNVDDMAHVSTTLDNPAIHKYASIDGSPAKNAGKFDGSPMSDGKMVKVDVEDYYTGMKGADMFPSVSNPYAPKPGEFKIHGEKAIDDDENDLGTYQGGDTWPNLKNPYLPDHGMTMKDTSKLLHGSE